VTLEQVGLLLVVDGDAVRFEPDRLFPVGAVGVR